MPKRQTTAPKTGRKLICNAKFGKFSLQKRTDDGKQKLSLPTHIPHDDLQPETAATLFQKTRVRMEFSRRPIGDWNQPDLPGTENDAKRIISCETDIVAYGWAANKWAFKFLIDTELFSIDEANDFWTCEGSVRIECIGKAITDDDDDEDTDLAEPLAKKHKPSPKQKELPATETPSASTDEFGMFKEVTTYPLTLKTVGAEGCIRVAEAGGKFYGEVTVAYEAVVDGHSMKECFGEGSPTTDSKGTASLRACMECVIGSLIDDIQDSPLRTTELIDDCRRILKEIAAGEMPVAAHSA